MKIYRTSRAKETIRRYGLLRRSEAVIQQFQRFSFSKSCTVLDIGTAEGLILANLQECCRLSGCLGLDLSLGRLKHARKKGLPVMQANGEQLPLGESSIDIIISIATFKHVRNLRKLLLECCRVLRPGGRLIVVDPTPLGIRLGLLLGHFRKQGIHQILSLKATQQMLTNHGFKLIRAERFMLSPIPFVGSENVERVLKQMHLDQLFFDQVVCAERPISPPSAHWIQMTERYARTSLPPSPVA